MNPSEVRATLDTAAQAIAAQPTGSWPGWVTYLLECLEEEIAMQDQQKVLDHRFAQRWMLNDIKQSIEARLEAGGW